MTTPLCLGGLDPSVPDLGNACGLMGKCKSLSRKEEIIIAVTQDQLMGTYGCDDPHIFVHKVYTEMGQTMERRMLGRMPCDKFHLIH